MIWPRFSLAQLMSVVLWIAVNCAALRILLGWKRDLAVGLVLVAPLLQLAAWQLFRRAARRAFWAGFFLCGLAATIAFGWAMLTPPVIGLNRSTTVYVVKSRGSWAWSVWDAYINIVVERLERPVERWQIDPETRITIAALRIVVWSLPQLAAAFAGGVLALACAAVVARNAANVRTTPVR